MMIDKERVRDLAIANIDHVMDALYTDVINNLQVDLKYSRHRHRITGDCLAIDHPGDRDSGAFSWSDERNCWTCFTHHCEVEYGADIFGLVQGALGIGFRESLVWLDDLLKNKPLLVPKRTQTSVNKNNKSISNNKLRLLERKYDYLIARGFNTDIAKKFEVGIWRKPNTFMHNRLIFPVRNEDNILVGFSGRSLYDDIYREKLEESKWKHSANLERYQPFYTGSILYNLNNAKKCNTKKIIIVEGPLDGLKLEQAGIKNWVAILGTSFSETAKTLLLGTSFQYVDIALDPDDAGLKSAKKIGKTLKEYFSVRIIQLPADPGDCSIPQLLKIWRKTD